MAPVSSHIGKTMIGMTKLGMIWAITLQLGIYLPIQHMKNISELIVTKILIHQRTRIIMAIIITKLFTNLQYLKVLPLTVPLTPILQQCFLVVIALVGHIKTQHNLRLMVLITIVDLE